jgi:hypothetical protein
MKRQEVGHKFQKKDRRNTIDLRAFGSTRRKHPMTLYGKLNWRRSER